MNKESKKENKKEIESILSTMKGWRESKFSLINKDGYLTKFRMPCPTEECEELLVFDFSTHTFYCPECEKITQQDVINLIKEKLDIISAWIPLLKFIELLPISEAKTQK